MTHILNNMKSSFYKIFLTAFVLIPIFISGCSVNVKGGASNAPAPDPGGVFKSLDKGEAWKQKNLIPTVTGRPETIVAFSANVLVFDPEDKNTIYFGTPSNGLYYSLDAGETWQQAKKLGNIPILAVAVDPKNKCLIYAASGNKVYQSNDCSRTWIQIFFDTQITLAVNAIAIDSYNPARIFIGTSRGEIIESDDRGGSWRTAARLDNSVDKIVMNPYDSRIMFASTAKKGLYRSLDSGATWISMKDKLKEFKKSNTVEDIAVSASQNGTWVIASANGILTTTDNGDTWKVIELITPDKNTKINAFAINPKEAKEMYYLTDTTFYRSLDGGAAWTPKKLPTARAGWVMLVDPENPNIIYMGVRTLQKK
jgi:photosystem II stability/assembly factor-like uncharacterized protein